MRPVTRRTNARELYERLAKETDTSPTLVLWRDAVLAIGPDPDKIDALAARFFSCSDAAGYCRVPECSECGKSTPMVIDVGDPTNRHEGVVAYLCGDCLRTALALYEKTEIAEEQAAGRFRNCWHRGTRGVSASSPEGIRFLGEWRWPNPCEYCRSGESSP